MPTPAHVYRFVTTWRVEATLDEVAAVLGEVEALTRWWPSVYLAVREVEPGEPGGVGKVVDLYTKGWLPYTLRWRFRVAEVDYGRRVALAAEGDFIGRGVWRFAQEGPTTTIVYEWEVEAAKPLLRRLSPVLRPIFAANHRWAMAMGEASLRLELARRRAATPEERAAIPAPPGPTTTSALPLAVGGAGALALLALALRRHTMRRVRNGGKTGASLRAKASRPIW